MGPLRHITYNTDSPVYCISHIFSYQHAGAAKTRCKTLLREVQHWQTRFSECCQRNLPPVISASSRQKSNLNTASFHPVTSSEDGKNIFFLYQPLNFWARPAAKLHQREETTPLRATGGFDVAGWWWWGGGRVGGREGWLTGEEKNRQMCRQPGASEPLQIHSQALKRWLILEPPCSNKAPLKSGLQLFSFLPPPPTLPWVKLTLSR